MNKDILTGNWKQLKGEIKENWGKLTDDKLSIIEGQRDKLSGIIQEQYGLTLESAEEEIASFKKRNNYS